MKHSKSNSFSSWSNKILPKILLPFALFTGHPVLASENTNNIPVYFGVGCFWHVQHEFVQAEKAILKRSDNEVTAIAGYAGGTKSSKNLKVKPDGKGVVCYHNLQGFADYGSLGHGEVVGLNIPSSSIKAFANEYFSLFGKDGDRPDKGDRGPEYRSLLGLPGGIKSPLFPDVQEEAEKKGLTLKVGAGNDRDTLGTKSVWVMDSNQFPVYQAEIYHQYHDGFMPGESYPQSYNSLAKQAYSDGRISLSGCPDSVP